MRTLRTGEAARYLDVSANTLRSWEQRFGYPRPERSTGRHRLYSVAELTVLRDALRGGLAVSSAISAARDTLNVDAHTLTTALLSFDYARADEAMERTLALRTFERAVTEVLARALEEIEERHGFASAPWAFASTWSLEWLDRSKRLAANDGRTGAVLFVDCIGEQRETDLIYARILELLCVRAGVSTLRLPIGAQGSLERATSCITPGLIILYGRWAPENETVRFVRFVRAHTGAIGCTNYRRVRNGVFTRDQLPDEPEAARSVVVERLARGLETATMRRRVGVDGRIHQ